MKTPEIRLAEPGDTERLLALYGSVRKWIADIGSDQWGTNTPDKVRSRLGDSIRRRECFVAEIDGEIVGMITVDGFADPEFWRSDDSPEDALYVHRMVVDRGSAGMNIGGHLLDWAEKVASREGKSRLRLDAWRTNEQLHAYYLRQGFSLVRVVSYDHRGSGALFEKAISGRTQHSR